MDHPWAWPKTFAMDLVCFMRATHAYSPVQVTGAFPGGFLQVLGTACCGDCKSRPLHDDSGYSLPKGASARAELSPRDRQCEH